MAQFNLKLPEGMLERWREIADKRGTSLALMIREAVNKDIDRSTTRPPDKPVG